VELSETIMEINDLHEFVAAAFGLVKAGRRFCTPQSPLCSLPLVRRSLGEGGFPLTFFFQRTSA
jgi:endonuclease III